MSQTNETKENIYAAARRIADAKAVLITAGAGLGVDSGMHIYRSELDFAESHPAAHDMGLKLSDMSNIELFDTNPHLAWGFFAQRQKLYKQTQPHSGYQILWEICIGKRYKHFVYTSNVDGHFIRSGFDPERVVEAHGNINYLQCVDTSKSQEVWPIPPKFSPVIDDQTMLVQDPLPSGPPTRLPKDQVLARPAIRLFTDRNWINQPFLDKEKDMLEFVQKITNKAKPFVVIEIGAGDRDPRLKVRQLGEKLAQNHELCTLIRINPNSDDVLVPHPEKNIAIQLPALAALVRIESLMKFKQI